MSTVYSIAQRTPALNSLFAGLACAIALALTAGPAMARPVDAAKATAAAGTDGAYRAAVAEKR
ncbi:hypothetical protein [Roseateles sp.]|jgi:hypothetical protein|uniref:hypothetical protein n=1 Tax=Roseateles sp. TaxID=1971397 RepID=UPI003BA8FAFB